jgi:hypothetical protein
MMRLKIIVEGQTEELFVKETLAEYLADKGFSVQPIIVLTSKKNGKPYRGGFRRTHGYEYAANYIAMLIKDDIEAVYATMFDFYGFPQDVGCYGTMLSMIDIYNQAECLERFIYQDILNRVGRQIKFIPFIEMHEFEAFLFANPAAYVNYGITPEQVKAIIDIRKAYDTPEHINNGFETAPSKRLMKIIEGYDNLKVTHGSIYAGMIGIDTIRNECKHFNSWFLKLDEFANTLNM